MWQKKMRRTPMFADKTCFFSKYEYYTTHYIVCSAFCCLCMCCCATTIQITIPSPAAACTVLAKMRSQAFLPLRNEPYDFAVVHAYDDLNKNMTADLNSIHSTVVNSVSEMWIKHKDFQKEQMAVIVSSVKKGSFFTMYITQL